MIASATRPRVLLFHQGFGAHADGIGVAGGGEGGVEGGADGGVDGCPSGTLWITELAGVSGLVVDIDYLLMLTLLCRNKGVSALWPLFMPTYQAMPNRGRFHIRYRILSVRGSIATLIAVEYVYVFSHFLPSSRN